MLPFVRMLEYGNVKPIPVGIKKINVCIGALHVLYEDGTLYGVGSNSQGQLGLGALTSVSTLTLIDSGVTDLHETSNRSPVLAYSKGNLLYMSGDTGGWYATPNNQKSPVLITDLSSVLSSYGGISYSIKVSRYNICLLINKSSSTTLLISGYKTCINGGVVSSQAFVKQSDDVKDYIITDWADTVTNCFYLMNNGNLMGLGSNSSGQISPSSIGQVYSSAYLVDFGSISSVYAVDLRVTWAKYSQILGRGGNAGNSLGPGTGNVTTNTVLYNNLTPTPINSTNVRLGSVFNTTVVGVFDNANSPNYGAGKKGIGGIGSGVSYLGAPTSTTVTTPTLYQEMPTVRQMITALNICAFLIDNKVYLCAQDSTISTTTVPDKTYFEVPLPK